MAKKGIENLNLKSESMLNFIIKTHQKDTLYAKPHLFILNKGLNSGKPQKTEFTNSFVIIFSNEEDLETVYWIAYSLWKSRYWHQFLCGSVIPFLRINDLKHNFTARVNTLLIDHEQHQKDIKTLRLLELKETQFHENINLINDLRRVILYRYCKR
jgi:hypothetical protein